MSKKANYMDERLKKLDAFCLNDEEKVTMDKLNTEYTDYLKDRKAQERKLAWNSVKAVGFGSPFGAIGAAKNACKLDKTQDRLTKIDKQREDIRARAHKRYAEAAGMTPDKVLDKELVTADEDYSIG